MIRKLNEPYSVLVVVLDADAELATKADLAFDGTVAITEAIATVVQRLQAEQVIPEYAI